MCDPMTLAIAAAATAAVGTGVPAYSAYQQGQYRAKVAERNASMEREAAQQEITNTREQALQHYRNVARIKGQQRLAAAANGVGLDFGTAGDVQADTDMLGREDARRIYEQGFQNLRGRDISASNFMGEASAARSQATGALVSGLADMGSTVLSGASQYNKLNANRIRTPRRQSFG